MQRLNLRDPVDRRVARYLEDVALMPREVLDLTKADAYAMAVIHRRRLPVQVEL